MTTAIRMLLDFKVAFTSHEYKYEERGGTTVSSRELGVPENVIVKTMIMETDTKAPIIVLMSGDKEVSTKNLARFMGVKSISPCQPEVANKHSGFVVGGTSPFGTKKKMPVFLHDKILDTDEVYINGGRRGYLVKMKSSDIVKVLDPKIGDFSA
ncbi:MAG: aminoacyl-tRNA deacylase [Bdellovibrionota bacterium]